MLMAQSKRCALWGETFVCKGFRFCGAVNEDERDKTERGNTCCMLFLELE